MTRHTPAASDRSRTTVLSTIAALLAMSCCALGMHHIDRAAAQDPFGAPATPVPSQDETAAEEADDPRNPPADPDPRVQAVRALQPRTPRDLAFAARTMMDFGRLDECHRYLKILILDQPDPNALLAMHQRVGSNVFLRWSLQAELQPEGRQLAQAVMQVVAATYRNPTRLRQLAIEAAAAQGPEQTTRLNDLRQAGHHGLEAVIHLLAHGDEAQVAGAGRLLLAWGKPAEQALVGALDGDQELRGRVIDLLARLQSPTALPTLLGPAVNPDDPDHVRASAGAKAILGRAPRMDEATGYLRDQAQQLLTGAELIARADSSGLVEIWGWDAKEETSRLMQLPLQDANFLQASRLAAELMELDDTNSDHLHLFLLTQLETEKRLAGLDRPVSTDPGSPGHLALTAGTQPLVAVLQEALKQRLYPAAAACCELLGATGDLSLVNTAQRESLLVSALRAPDRRVQFAAVTAIVKLDPRSGFSGASLVPDTLGFFARSQGTSRVLIAHHDVSIGQSLVGTLSSLGFQADTVQTGRSMVQRAVENPDIEFILVGARLSHPVLNEAIQWLRSSPRGKNLPIAVMARSELLPEAQRWIEKDRFAFATLSPFDIETLSIDIQRVRGIVGRNAIPVDVRYEQAAQAMSHLARLSSDLTTYSFYEIARQTPVAISGLGYPLTNEAAAEFLGQLGTPQAQTALIEFASQDARALESRQSAVAAFAKAVDRRGLRLTKAQILTAYDQYNASEFQDADTQRVLGEILDAIEGPTASRQADQ